MSEKGLTTIALKKINRSKIYQYIYRSKLTSKLQIVQDLQMGLSTVSQNLNLLENEGLIEKNGYFDSTGGRKANAIQIVSDFRISIGVGILKNMFHITAIDLYGNTVYTDTIPLTYSNTAAYYQQITDKVKDFIDKNQYPENKILGVSIATQGITSPDNTTVIYFTDVFVIDHAHEGTVIGFFYLMLHQNWGNHQIKDDQHQKHNAVIVDQRLFWGFYFFHGCSPFLCKLIVPTLLPLSSLPGAGLQ